MLEKKMKEACLAAQPVSVTLEETALEVFENVFAEPCIHTHDGDLKRMAAALAAVTPAIEAKRDKAWEKAIEEEGLRYDWLLNVRARLTPAPEPKERVTVTLVDDHGDLKIAEIEEEISLLRGWRFVSQENAAAIRILARERTALTELKWGAKLNEESK